MYLITTDVGNKKSVGAVASPGGFRSTGNIMIITFDILARSYEGEGREYYTRDANDYGSIKLEVYQRS